MRMHTQYVQCSRTACTVTTQHCAEMDSGPVPLPNEKSLKEKKRKLEETLNGVVKYLVSLSEGMLNAKKAFCLVFATIRICCMV